MTTNSFITLQNKIRAFNLVRWMCGNLSLNFFNPLLAVKSNFPSQKLLLKLIKREPFAESHFKSRQTTWRTPGVKSVLIILLTLKLEFPERLATARDTSKGDRIVDSPHIHRQVLPVIPHITRDKLFTWETTTSASFSIYFQGEVEQFINGS